MSKVNNGGPAFPTQDRGFRGRGDLEGMSVYDWFAGQALSNPAICTGTDREYNLRAWFGERGGVTKWEIAAMQARKYAEAMMRERSS